MSFYEKTGSSASSGDHRRKWDTEEFARRAAERLAETEAEEKGKDGLPPGIKIKKELLQARDYKVDLESKLGKSVVINKSATSAESGGFYCNVCDCVVKDSINFLDHINGKNHQRNMGMSMKVKRSTADDIREKLAMKKIEQEQKKREQRYEEMLDDVHEEEARLADSKRDKKDSSHRKRKREPVEEEGDGDDLDPELKAMMGFGGFGAGPKKK